MCDTQFTVEEYATSARVIQLHLEKFCNKNLVATDQIAEAARLAKKHIERLELDNYKLKKCVEEYIEMCRYNGASIGKKTLSEIKKGLTMDGVNNNE